MKYYLEESKAVLDALGSSPEGLSEEKARERLAENGKNQLEAQRKPPLLLRFLGQFADPMVVVLLCAAAISGAVSLYAGESFADSLIILAVVVMNALMGMIQESKAERAIEALANMTAPVSHVLREGKIRTLPSEELVVGDILLLEAGDAVGADGRILESVSLKTEESALTGESLPVEKTASALGGGEEIPLGDRKNMLYRGSAAVYGRGKAVITATGMDTEMGKIAHVLTSASRGETPLQKKLAALSRTLTWLVLGICAFIFLFSLIRGGDFTTAAVLDTFMLAVSLAVAAIPEGLAAVVTIVLSMGVTKMSGRSAIIRRLTAVETLGCTQVICSDKTGTLTQNKMTVTRHWGSDRALFCQAAVLCSDAWLGEKDLPEGEPTECALLAYARESGLNIAALREQYPRIGEIPFESRRKMMTTVHRQGGRIVQFTKGAPDELLRKCTAVLRGGKAVPLTEELRREILAVNHDMAAGALRVIGAAMRSHAGPPTGFGSVQLERELVFIGLAGMMDPVRPQVKDAIAACRRAGIRPVMITGDHLDTAVAIARELGLISSPDQAITGARLDELDDRRYRREVDRYAVYARVKPEHKVRIVEAWKARGCVTAMTGDGVNDAPALKCADIGVGMGISGADVTKNVADMILSDDNFATIVSAVEEGRRIYDNICKAIQFLLSSNLSEVLSIFLATVMGFVILNPIHILWINLITDSLPALALGMEPAEPGIMTCRPRGTQDSIFSGGVGKAILFQGLAVALLTLAAYFTGAYMEYGMITAQSSQGMTMAFLTMSMAEIFHSVNMRSQRKSLFALKAGNGWLTGAMLLSLVLTTAVIYLPLSARLFGFAFIGMIQYFLALGLAFLIIPVVEWEKALHKS